MALKSRRALFLGATLLVVLLSQNQVFADDDDTDSDAAGQPEPDTPSGPAEPNPPANPEPAPAEPRKLSICELYPMPGVCISRIMMWHYDCDSNECKEFAWGGCGGNRNRFREKAECEAACKKGAVYCKSMKKPRRERLIRMRHRIPDQ